MEGMIICKNFIWVCRCVYEEINV